jgi:membrane peptidoglycan carboxypeptidase
MPLHRFKYHITKIREHFSQGEKLNWKKILVWTGLILSGLFVTGVIALIILIAIVSIGLPNVHDLDKLTVAQSTTIYDREGNVLYVKHGAENREYIGYEQISKNIINATVAIEDDQYWEHPGFDAVGIARAMVNNLFHFGIQQGGSTITQQYIKYTFLSSEKSYIRKLKELILAVQLEQAYDKKKILELYLNKIPYGNNAFGVEKASQIYFDKHAKDLDLAESSILASIVQRPSYYNPYGEHLYSKLVKEFKPEDLAWRKITSESDLGENEFARGLIGKFIRIDDTHNVYIQGRSDLVFRAMLKMGTITEAEKEQALAELQTMKINESKETFKHAHFVFYILDQLEEKYGKEIVEQGGLKVYTSLDPKLQDVAEKVVADGAKINEEKFNAKNASLIAIDPKTGEILAMVGSRNYDDKEIDGAVNVALQYRQPGSSFKPFVYAQAFYNRYAPGSIIFDTETRLGASAYPKNFDGKFWGPMSIRKALGQSRNIPAIKTYFLAGEQEPIKQLAEKMGIIFDPQTRNNDDGWPLALGSKEVRLIDMVSAFGVFANGGVRQKPVSILKVINANDEVLEEWKPDGGEEVLDPQIAYLINSILSDTSVRLSENLTISGHVNGAKTGTSNRQMPGKKYYPHDLWTIGYTPSLSAGVWTGNNRDDEGNISIYADGTNLSAPIWKKFMTEALKDKPSENFTVPDGIKEVAISTASGKLPGPNTPANQIVTEVFANFSVPTEIDDSSTVAQVDTRNNKLANEFCPEQFVTKRSFQNIHDIAPYPEWEKGAQAWIQSHMGETNGNIIIGPPPTATSELCTPENFNNKPDIQIISPAASEKIESGSNVEVRIKATAQNGLDRVEYYLDNQKKYFSTTFPFDGNIRLPKGEAGTNRHIISAKAIDKYGYSNQADVEIITAKNVSSDSSTSAPATSSSLPPSTTTDNSQPAPAIPIP